MSNFFDSIDPKKIQEAINVIGECIGPKEAEDMRKMFSGGSNGPEIPPDVSPIQLALIKNIIENPDMLRKVLSSPQGKAIIKQLTNQQ